MVFFMSSALATAIKSANLSVLQVTKDGKLNKKTVKHNKSASSRNGKSASVKLDKYADPAVMSLDKLLSSLDAWSQLYHSEPGFGLLIVKNSRLRFKGGFGLRNIENKTKITSSTLFELASLSKQFTALAILQLEYRGKLSLDDSISKYLPALHKRFHHLTIKNLLMHTSGLRDYLNDDPLISKQKTIVDMAHVYNWINKVTHLPLQSEVYYSNTNYALLADIVKKASNMSFSDYVTKNIFQPAGMNNTFVLERDFDIIKPHSELAQFYYMRNGEPSPISNNLRYRAPGASGIYSTLNDLERWINFIEHGLAMRNPVISKLIDLEKKEEQFPARVFPKWRARYAYGLQIKMDKTLDTNKIFHFGRLAGLQHTMVYYPRSKTWVIVLQNSSILTPSLCCIVTGGVNCGDSFFIVSYIKRLVDA